MHPMETTARPVHSRPVVGRYLVEFRCGSRRVVEARDPAAAVLRAARVVGLSAGAGVRTVTRLR